MFTGFLRVLLFLAVLTTSEAELSLFRIGQLDVTVVKLFNYLLLLGVGLKLALQPRGLPSHAKNRWLLAFAVAGVICHAASWVQGTPAGFIFVSLFRFYSVVLFYFMLVYLMEDQKDLRVVLWAMVVGGAVIATTAILGIGRMNYGSWTRAGGLGGNPNGLAMTCVIGIGTALLLLLEKPRARFRQAFLAFLMAIQFYGIILSVSRVGFLSFILMGGFLTVRSRRFDLLRLTIPIALVAGIALYMLAPPQFFDRMGTLEVEAQRVTGEAESPGRLLQFYWGFRAFVSNPIIGVGPGRFEHWVRAQDYRVGIRTPHNSPLELAADMGLIGLVPWLMAIVLTWTDFSRTRRIARTFARRSDPELLGLDRSALFLQAVFLAWLLASLVGPLAFDKPFFLLFAIGTVLVHRAQQRATLLAGEPSQDPQQPPLDAFRAPERSRSGALPSSAS